jgi:hypothetical protein
LPRTYPAYPPEFRREAIRVVRVSDEEHPRARPGDPCLRWHPLELGKSRGDRLRPARRAHNAGEGGTPETLARGEDPPPGESDLKKSSGLLRQRGDRRRSVSVFRLIDARRPRDGAMEAQTWCWSDPPYRPRLPVHGALVRQAPPRGGPRRIISEQGYPGAYKNVWRSIQYLK